MKTISFIKTHWPAMIAAAVIATFVTCAAHSIIQSTINYLIDWTK